MRRILFLALTTALLAVAGQPLWPPALAQASDPLAGASTAGFEVPTPRGWQVERSEPTLHLTRSDPAGEIHVAAFEAGDAQDAVLAALRG